MANWRSEFATAPASRALVRWSMFGVVAVSAFGVGWIVGRTSPTPRSSTSPPPEISRRVARPAAPDPLVTGSVSQEPETRPSVLEGIPDVVDTVTLRLGRSVVRLYGIEWARGGRVEELSNYLNGRQVKCE